MLDTVQLQESRIYKNSEKHRMGSHEEDSKKE